MKVQTLTARLTNVIQTLGVVNGLWYLLAKAVARVGLGKVYRYGLVAQPVRMQPVTPEHRSKVTIRLVEEKEYKPEWFPRPLEVIRERYRQGARCLVAFKGDTAMGCIWIVSEKYVEDEIYCRYIMLPEKKTAWDFDVYLFPEYRFGRTFSRLWDATETLLATEGRLWCLSRIDVFNSASVRAHRTRGAIAIGQLACFRSGHIQLLLGTVSPYFHVSFKDRSMPNIVVRAPDHA